MATNFDMGGHIMEAVGPLWLVAVAGMFLSAICESSRPKPEEGEEKPQGLALLIAGIASLITPIMLFIYAFWSILSLEVLSGASIEPEDVINFAIAQRVVVIGLFGFLAVVAIAGSIVGWIIRAATPGFGKALNMAAVPLALATLALTVYVSYEAVAQFYAMATGARP
jgi:hypothetical protein